MSEKFLFPGWASSRIGSTSSPSPSPKMTGWQPIETAPTDGRDLIMTSTDWNGDILVGGFAFGKWRENPSPEGCSFTPTHWMPIPSIPAATTMGQGQTAEIETRACEALAGLRDAAKAGLKPNDQPHTVTFADGFALEGRAADEWHSFMSLIIKVADGALTPTAQSRVVGPSLTDDQRQQIIAVAERMDTSPENVLKRAIGSYCAKFGGDGPVDDADETNVVRLGEDHS